MKLEDYMYVTFSTGCTRSSNSYEIWKPYGRTNVLKYSFWHRYIDDWNSLPQNVVEAGSVSTFKGCLFKLLTAY